MTLHQFRDKYLGKQVEYHSYGGPDTWYQCVDLANAYIKEVLGLTPIIGTHAKDFRGNDQFDWIPNTPTGVPNAGDIIVWNGRVGGGYGHIAVVLNADVNRFTSLDQNWSAKQKVTIEQHNYSNVSGWLRPKESMSDSISVPKTVFEDLVTKSSKYDEFAKLGYSAASQIKQEVDSLKADLANARSEYRAEREKAEALRKEHNALIAEAAKALNTVQEPTQVITALKRVEANLDRLEDVERQLAELQVDSGAEKEELRAEIERLKALIKYGNINNFTTEELVAEIIKRIQKILLRRS